MKTKIIITAAMAALLSACVSQPAQTLDQKLAAAATAKEKAEIKRLICLKETYEARYRLTSMRTITPSQDILRNSKIL